MPVAVVTDSTACLPPQRAATAGVSVVPLHVTIGPTNRSEGVDVTAAEVADLLRRGKEQVGTSRPSPGELVAAYRAAAARSGAAAVVALHLSEKVSGTVEGARLAAEELRGELEVEVVDTRVVGMALGYAVLSAAAVAGTGGSVPEVAEVARRRAAGSVSYFYVDTLEHLRRGGRIGPAAALLGSALAIKPLLTLRDGEVQPSERVRTRARALARLEERCREAVASARGPVDVAVHHLDWAEQAREVRARLGAVLPEGSGLDLVELSAVLGVHTGPGTLAVVVSPRDPQG